MKPTIEAFRCEHCDKLIDPVKEFFVKFMDLHALVHFPENGEFIVAEVRLKCYDWQTSKTIAVCSEACMSNFINKAARDVGREAPAPLPPIAPPEEPEAPKEEVVF